MRYKPKSVAALEIALAGLSARTRVEVDPGIGVSAKTVGELRKLAEWPSNLAITIPQGQHSGMIVHVGKANVATRVSPKP